VQVPPRHTAETEIRFLCRACRSAGSAPPAGAVGAAHGVRCGSNAVDVGAHRPDATWLPAPIKQPQASSRIVFSTSADAIGPPPRCPARVGIPVDLQSTQGTLRLVSAHPDYPADERPADERPADEVHVVGKRAVEGHPRLTPAPDPGLSPIPIREPAARRVPPRRGGGNPGSADAPPGPRACAARPQSFSPWNTERNAGPEA